MKVCTARRIGERAKEAAQRQSSTEAEWTASLEEHSCHHRSEPEHAEEVPRALVNHSLRQAQVGLQ